MSKTYKRDWFPWILTSIIIIFSSLPYIIGWAKSTDSMQFGGLLFAVQDANSYIAKMMGGAYGDWIFRTPYTAMYQGGFLAFLPYLLLGKLASFFVQRSVLIILFHLFRCAGIIFLVMEVWKFVRLIISDMRTARLASMLVLMGGGLGWIEILWLNRDPLAFYSPEAFSHMMILGLPHLCFARALLLKAFRLFLKNGKSQGEQIGIGIWLLLGGLFQPVFMSLGIIVLAVWLAYRWVIAKQINFRTMVFQAINMLLLPGLFALYTLFRFYDDSFLSVWRGQSYLYSPSPLQYLFAYGPGLFFVALYLVWKKRGNAKLECDHYLLIWLLVVPLLLYLPSNVQRRFSESIWVVLAIFSAAGLIRIRKKIFLYLAAGIFLITPLFFYTGMLREVLRGGEPVYHSADLMAICEQLNKVQNRDQIVLAPYDESNFLPSCAPITVMTGHGAESANLDELEPLIVTFYENQTGLDKLEPFAETGSIQFVLIPRSGGISEEWVTQMDVHYRYENDSYILIERKDR